MILNPLKKLPDHLAGILAIVIAALLWSTGGLFIKLITLDAYQISFLRSIFSALTFLVIFRKKALIVNPAGLLNGLFYLGVLVLFVAATKLTTAANAIFLQYTAPVYVLIFEPLIVKTPYKKINVITVIICFLGMLLFFVGKIEPGHMTGNILALISGISFACLLIGLKKNKKEYQISSIFYGNIFIVLLCSFFSFPGFNISVNDLLYIAFLGIFQIGIAYAFFSFAMKRIEGIEAALIGMIEPVLNPVWVFLGYGEIPSVYAITGGFVILVTIIIRTFLVEKKFNYI